MKIISSQQYVNWDLVEEKKAQMIEEGVTKIELPCWAIGEFEDVGEVAILSDGHHRYQAARDMDSDYYYVETSDLDNNVIDRVW